MNPIIETRDLTKIYKTRQGQVRAVDQLDLIITQGEFFCLLGPNGAGKTTTIKMLITLAQPTAGAARVYGYDVQTHSRQVRQNIGYASQEIIADEMLTGRENLALVARLQGVPASELRERVQSMLEMLKLTEWADRLVKTYSGGMRKKLDLAGALIHHPPILFLDEPTLGLDPQARRVIWNYLQRLNREQKITLFMTTHYLDEADALADRVAIIDHGRIKAMDSPDALKRQVDSDSLDDAFMKLTGSTLREGAAPAAWVTCTRTAA